MTVMFRPNEGSSSNWGSAPFLAFGDTPDAIASAVRTTEAAGLRLADAVSVKEAAARLDRQMNNGGVWLELEGNVTAELDHLLRRLETDADAGLYPVVAVVSRELIDLAFARLTAPSIQILIEPDAVERAAALAVAGSGLAVTKRLSDVATDSSALRLRQLSDEVSRIAATLSRLSAEPGTPSAVVATPPTRNEPPPRRWRQRRFGPSSGRGGCGPIIYPPTCLPTRRGICCWTCCRRRSCSIAYLCRACASPLQFRPPRRYGGSRP